MALHTGSGFSQLAQIDSQIRAAIASLPTQAPVGHQPYVSKKKEARRKRDEEARRLAELNDASLNEIVFATPESQPVTEAAQSKLDLAELEREMRAQLGLDVPPPVVETKPAAKPKTMPKQVAKRRVKPSPFVSAPAPAPVPVVEKTAKQLIKRQLEVLLQVLRPDGIQVPFYYCDPGISEFVAEINAAKKARGYGLQVLGTLSITTKEYACHT